MREDFVEDLNWAASEQERLRILFRKWKHKQPKNLDQAFETTHNEVFNEINCLDCANCCKTTSPIFRDIDIKRIAKHLKIKEARFVASYLHMDEDNDWVLKTAPCAFLGDDNRCSIYEDRPQACREYPHTDRKRIVQILDLTLKNTTICPATARIVKLVENKLT